MESTFKSVGGFAPTPASVAHPDKFAPPRGRRRSSDEFAHLDNAALLALALGYLDKMRASQARANVLALEGCRVPTARERDRRSELCAAIEDETCDRAFELSARDVVKALAKRLQIAIGGDA